MADGRVTTWQAKQPNSDCGWTVYDAWTTAVDPFGYVFDVTLANGEVDPTLMELARIVQEESLVAEYGLKPRQCECWRLSDQNNPTFNMSRTIPCSRGAQGTSAEYQMSPYSGGCAPIDESKLDALFHEYINIEKTAAWSG